MKKQLWTGLGASIGMLILILDGKTALEGARQGVDLCVRTVVPSLFPFFLLSILLTGAFMGTELPFLRPLGRLFSLPVGAESLLIPAFLGGYPAGAQSITQAYRAGQLTKNDAERLLSFCNNAGPAFLFGMTAAAFPEKWMVWPLWIIHIGSALLVSGLFPASRNGGTIFPEKPVTLSGAMISSLKVMAQVCGWVVLFRVILAFLNRWLLWILPVEVQVAVTGLLELSNGCCVLNIVESVPLRFVICSGMLAFGGLCVTMQTVSVASGISLKWYFVGKLLQTVISLLLSAGSVWHPIFLLPLSFLLYPRIFRKNSRNPAAIGV